MIRTITFSFFLTLLLTFNAVAQFSSLKQLDPVPVSTNTGEKPQSKVWSYGGRYWAVLPNASGTHLWRLDGTSWTNILKLSNRNTSKADCKLAGNAAHILLFQGASSELVSVEYNAAQEKYVLWSKRSSTVGLNFDEKVETATIDIDGTGRMWLASDGASSIYVNWSDPPYQFWSQRIQVASGISDDDIGALVAMPGKIGVLWSNQKTKLFGFRTHIDGTDPGQWSVDEKPAAQSAQNIGGGMADDHINMVVASDGTLYAAVKTSYDNTSYPEIALLVRRPSGAWDNLYDVSRRGTRPIVVLDEANSKIVVVYTSKDGGGDILYKESPVGTISFGEEHRLMSGLYNNTTSTKDSFSEDIVILASNNTHAVGVLASSPVIPLPVELVSFSAKRVDGDALLQWVTASELDNDYFGVEVSADGKNFDQIGTVLGKGTTQLKSFYSFTDRNIYRYNSGQVYYRLRQVDYSGEATLGPVRGVQSPVLSEALSIRAYPNPFSDHLQVQVTSSEMVGASLLLYNSQGSVILTLQPRLNPGYNTFDLEGISLAEGIYFLSVSTQEQQKVIKIMRR